ncbi:tetratricopeptide repeat protein [Neisseria sp. Ec49-e6-T10]|uniref:tetratricopeptide repeat protein n=1 Tax=Neisseria sp. Ec49-e6-T10 TaxID=3140744 RepID=UPI003EB86F2B
MKKKFFRFISRFTMFFVVLGISGYLFFDIQKELFSEKNNHQINNHQTKTIKHNQETLMAYQKGMQLTQGKERQQDIPLAMSWFKKAADQGHEPSQYNLAALYITQYRNYQAAKPWLLASASQGNPKSQMFLGKLYYEGTHLPQNIPEATKWFQEAAKNNQQEATAYLGKIYLLNNKDTEKARPLLEKAANENNKESQYLLGTLHLQEKNIPLSALWLEKAANQNWPQAQLDLAILYGKHLQDYNKMFYWSEKAANHPKFPLGKALLGYVYQQGLGTEPNTNQAKYWSDLAEQQGVLTNTLVNYIDTQ